MSSRESKNWTWKGEKWLNGVVKEEKINEKMKIMIKEVEEEKEKKYEKARWQEPKLVGLIDRGFMA